MPKKQANGRIFISSLLGKKCQDVKMWLPLKYSELVTIQKSMYHRICPSLFKKYKEIVLLYPLHTKNWFHKWRTI